MKKGILFVTVALLLASGAALYTISVDSQSVPSHAAVSKPTVSELLSLVNADRAKNGVAPLKEDSRLDQSAQMKADDEVKYKYFGHISPADSPFAGHHGYEYINQVGINCKADSENLTENSFINDASHAVAAWIDSPTHHQAMINPDYTLTGFGINGDEIVEHFCS